VLFTRNSSVLLKIYSIVSHTSALKECVDLTHHDICIHTHTWYICILTHTHMIHAYTHTHPLHEGTGAQRFTVSKLKSQRNTKMIKRGDWEIAARSVVVFWSRRAWWRRISPGSAVLEPTPNTQRLPLLSYVLRSAWGLLGPDCWRCLHSAGKEPL